MGLRRAPGSRSKQTIRTKLATIEQIVPGKATRNAAPRSARGPFSWLVPQARKESVASRSLLTNHPSIARHRKPTKITCHGTE
jgi:hypothetical protein